MQSLKIVSDTRGKLQKIREGSVFTSNMGFVLELLQNSLRAKATRVDISIDYDKKIVEFVDNGVGCKKPENIFTLDNSSWESTSEGFGIGFWSVLAYPVDKVTVDSKNWSANIDVNRIFEENNLEVETVVSGCITNGFRVRLFCNEEADILELKRYIVEQSETQDYDVYINNQYVDKRNLFDEFKRDYVYVRDVKTSLFEGVIGVSGNSKVKIFYEGRYVCSEYICSGVEGVLKLKKGALTYKEPDRRAVIYDARYNEFERRFRIEVSKLYKESIPEMSFEDMTSYSYGIKNNLDLKQYKAKLRVTEEIFMRASNVVVKSKKRKVKSLDDSSVAVEYMPDNESVGVGDELCVAADKEAETSKVICAKGTVSYSSVESDDKESVNSVIPSLQQQNDTSNVSSESEFESSFIEKDIDIKKMKKVLWVESSMVDSFLDEIASARYAGFNIVKAPNDLYNDLFVEYGIPHLSEINDICFETFKVKNIEARNNKELRMLELLEPIREYFGLSKGLFRIANIEAKIEYIYNGTVLGRTSKKNTFDEFIIRGAVYDGYIYLDRAFLNAKKIRFTSQNIGLNEMKFLMHVLPTVSHELAHYLYGTNDETMSHYEKQIALERKIIDIYAS